MAALLLLKQDENLKQPSLNTTGQPVAFLALEGNDEKKRKKTSNFN